MDKLIKFAIIAIAVIIPLSSISVYYGNQNTQPTISRIDSKPLVISSFNIIHEFAKNIGHEKIDLVLLIPAGEEAHDWEPTINEIQNMQNADIILVNGQGLESWTDNVNLINSKVRIVDTSKGIQIKKDFAESSNTELSQNFENEDHRNIKDPHIWLNPVMVKVQIQNIENAFSEIDPENQKFYQTNAQEYLIKLEKLDKDIRSELSKCKSDFISTHNAFSLFADEYGLVQHSIIDSVDSHLEPSPKMLEKIINLAKQKNIKIVFTNESIDKRIPQVIANEIQGKILALSTLEFSDPTQNYFERMYGNLSNLKEALCI